MMIVVLKIVMINDNDGSLDDSDCLSNSLADSDCLSNYYNTSGTCCPLLLLPIAHHNYHQMND